MASLYQVVVALSALGGSLPLVAAHHALWDKSMYGFNADPSVKASNPAQPMSGLDFDSWWFHGNLKDKGTSVMSIPAGDTLTVQLACNKIYTTFGKSTDSASCPGDSGAYHAGGETNNPGGWEGNSEDMLRGCALAIAYKSDAASVRPEDFTVFSIQERCVRQRETNFDVPANMPACPDGECTCAWFWQGQNSREEMYMTGFRCNVKGGVEGGKIPVPAKPRRGGAISGPTQPMYWANDLSNIGYTPTYNNRPSYDSRFGWQNGAQVSAFGSGGSGGTGAAGGSGANSTTKVTDEAPETTKTATTSAAGAAETGDTGTDDDWETDDSEDSDSSSSDGDDEESETEPESESEPESTGRSRNWWSGRHEQSRSRQH